MTAPKKWLRFNKLYRNPSRLTDTYDVVNVSEDVNLGQIRWFGPFRKYAFHPTNGTVYDAGCLTEITDKLNELMQERQEERDPR